MQTSPISDSFSDYFDTPHVANSISLRYLQFYQKTLDSSLASHVSYRSTNRSTKPEHMPSYRIGPADPPPSATNYGPEQPPGASVISPSPHSSVPGCSLPRYSVPTYILCLHCNAHHHRARKIRPRIRIQMELPQFATLLEPWRHSLLLHIEDCSLFLQRCKHLDSFGIVAARKIMRGNDQAPTKTRTRAGRDAFSPHSDMIKILNIRKRILGSPFPDPGRLTTACESTRVPNIAA